MKRSRSQQLEKLHDLHHRDDPGLNTASKQESDSEGSGIQNRPTPDKDEHVIQPEAPPTQNQQVSDKKLFIRNINFRTSNRKLWDFFKKFGEVKFCQLLTRKYHGRSKSRGIGFVTFVTTSGALCALSSVESERILDDRLLEVQPAFMYTKNQSEIENDATMQPPNGSIGAAEVTQYDPHDPAKPSMDSLTDDALLHVFGLLSVRDRIIHERVCKRWYHLLRRLWQSLEHLQLKNLFSKFGGLSDQNLTSILKRGCSSLTSLDVSSYSRMLSDPSLDAIGRCCPNLIRLDLSWVSASNKALCNLSKQCQNLQWIRLQCCYDFGEDGFWYLFRYCKQLKYINVEGNKRIQGQCLHKLGPEVTTMVLKGCSKLIDLGIEKIVTRCPKLTELNITECVRLTDAFLTMLAQGCPTLEILHMCGMYRHVTSGGLTMLGQIGNLQELYLSENRLLDDAVLIHISQGCSHLRVLDIASCHQEVTDHGVSALAQCCNLEVLDVSYLHQITSESVMNIFANGSLLKFIARGCGQLGDQAVSALIVDCPRLQFLDVSGCHDVTGQSLDAFLHRQEDGELHCILGGTSLDVGNNKDLLENVPGLLVSWDDLCQYHKRQDRELYHHMDEESDLEDEEYDEDSHDEDFNYSDEQGGAMYPALSPATAEDYLVNDDPLYDEEWDLS